MESKEAYPPSDQYPPPGGAYPPPYPSQSYPPPGPEQYPPAPAAAYPAYPTQPPPYDPGILLLLSCKGTIVFYSSCIANVVIECTYPGTVVNLMCSYTWVHGVIVQVCLIYTRGFSVLFITACEVYISLLYKGSFDRWLWQEAISSYSTKQVQSFWK